MATYENYLLVSFKVTLSLTHTPVPHAEKKVKPIKTERPSVSRLDLTRDNKCQEAARRVESSPRTTQRGLNPPEVVWGALRGDKQKRGARGPDHSGVDHLGCDSSTEVEPKSHSRGHLHHQAQAGHTTNPPFSFPSAP